MAIGPAAAAPQSTESGSSMAHTAVPTFQQVSHPSPAPRGAPSANAAPVLPLWDQWEAEDLRWREAPDTAEGRAEADHARAALESLLARTETTEGDSARLRARVRESLGDYWMAPQRFGNTTEAWPHYERALAFWASWHDLEEAQTRYLAIVWKMLPAEAVLSDPRTLWYQPLPSHRILSNALSVARSPADRSRALYWVALSLWRQGGQPQELAQVGEAFEAALAEGVSGTWMDALLFAYGTWLMEHGRASFDDRGEPRREPDFAAARAVFERLLASYAEGESRYLAAAEAALGSITAPGLEVMVPFSFRPGGEPQVQLRWRNLEQVELRLYPVHLIPQLILEGRTDAGWLEAIEVPQDTPPIHQATISVPARAPHTPVEHTHRVTAEIPTGAYLVEISASHLRARELLLVSDCVLVLKSSPTQVVLYFADSVTGAPIANAPVSVSLGTSTDASAFHWETLRGVTGGDGLAAFNLDGERRFRQVLATAGTESRQAIAAGSIGALPSPAERARWRVRAFADRPHFSPGERVSWKSVFRRETAEGIELPSVPEARVRVVGPRGAVAWEGSVPLTDLGSGWGSFSLARDSSPGLYHLELLDGSVPGERALLSRTPLFQVVETQVAEMALTLTSDPGGGSAPVLAGQPLGGRVELLFRSGGPVANHPVELRVRRLPFLPTWAPPDPFDPTASPLQDWAPGNDPAVSARSERVTRLDLRTDSRGVALFQVPTSASDDQDFIYLIEAVAKDDAGRESSGHWQVPVARQGFYAYLVSPGRIWPPSATREVIVRTLDAANGPVPASGLLRVTRERWTETWIDRRGREITGEALRDLKRRSGGWFSFGPVASDYVLKSEGYLVEEVALHALPTDADGFASLPLSFQAEGYYRLAWVGRDLRNQTVRAETLVWVSQHGSRDIGYRTGGVEVILDRQAVTTGEPVTALLTVPSAGRHVLLSLGAHELASLQVVHMEATSRLLRLDTGPEHSPNVFIEALMVADQSVRIDQRELAVFPPDQTLSVTVEPDLPGYRPRTEGRFTITVKDASGNPVPGAEVSFSLSREDGASGRQRADLASVFTSGRRALRTTTTSSIAFKGFYRPLEGGEDPSAETGDFWPEAAGSVFGRGLPSWPPAEEDAVGISSPPPPSLSSVPGIRGSSLVSQGQTLLWTPNAITDRNGQTVVTATFPDDLAWWRGTARAIAPPHKVGSGGADVATRQPLVARLRLPPFLVAGDTGTVEGQIQNHSARDESLSLSLSADPQRVRIAEPERQLRLRTGASASSAWSVDALSPGDASFELRAEGLRQQDTTQRHIGILPAQTPVYLRNQAILTRGQARFSWPNQGPPLPPGSTLRVRVSPSLAILALEAFPHLLRPSHEGPEQDLSLILAMQVLHHTLTSMGLDRVALQNRVRALVEPDHPALEDGLPRWREARLSEALSRLRLAATESGAWSYWPHLPPDPHLTAYVLWGLAESARHGLKVDPDLLQGARNWLLPFLVNPDSEAALKAWILHAAAASRAIPPLSRPSRYETRAFLELMGMRERLGARTLATLCLAAYDYGFEDDASILARSLQNSAREDPLNDPATAYQKPDGSPAAPPPLVSWAAPANQEYGWLSNEVESAAFALKALLRVDDRSDLVVPTLRWLMTRRTGAHWSHPRETAIVLSSLMHYLQVHDEQEAEADFSIELEDGRILTEVSVRHRNLLTTPATWEFDLQAAPGGPSPILLRHRAGSGPLYLSLEYESPSARPALPTPLRLHRQHYVVREMPTLLEGAVERLFVLAPETPARVGEWVESVILLESDRELPHLRLVDPRAASWEPPRGGSGQPLFARQLNPTLPVEARLPRGPSAHDLLTDSARYSGRSVALHQEARLEGVTFLLERLPPGVWEIRYRARVDLPGRYTVRPAEAETIHFPTTRASSPLTETLVTDSP